MAEFRIYNSMTKKKEVFKPIEPGKVSMYVCGVTAYAYSHIGHARAYVAFDVLVRYLRHLGYEVIYVRNFTDIDDKIIKHAADHDEDPLAFSERFIQEFHRDMADLQCLPPNEEPRVSEHMTQIIDMIQKIISDGSAYAVEGDVYFDVDVKKYPDYHTLFGRNNPDEKRKPEDEKSTLNPKKRKPDDFALWKGEKAGEISWDSPWGNGRPGWHIECSAMSAAHLPEKFDIHGGGMDLIFPHHVNEVVQSRAACENSKISYWMHNGFVNINNEKMSKSSKFFTIREVTNKYHPLALRHFLLGTHYRSPVNYSIDQIEDSSKAVFSIYQTLEHSESAISQYREALQNSDEEYRITPDAQICIDELKREFEEKLADDLRTTSILKNALDRALSFINTVLKTLKGLKITSQKLSNIKSLIAIVEEVRYVLDVLGLLSSSTYTEVLEQLKEKALVRAGLTKDELLQLIEERALARKEAIARKDKDFSKCDKIRSDLALKGIDLMDNIRDDNHTSWRPCVPTRPKSDADGQP